DAIEWRVEPQDLRAEVLLDGDAVAEGEIEPRPGCESVDDGFDGPREIGIVAREIREDVAAGCRQALVDGVVHAVVRSAHPPDCPALTLATQAVARPI